MSMVDFNTLRFEEGSDYQILAHNSLHIRALVHAAVTTELRSLHRIFILAVRSRSLLVQLCRNSSELAS
jgi:hypothetical protein